MSKCSRKCFAAKWRLCSRKCFVFWLWEVLVGCDCLVCISKTIWNRTAGHQSILRLYRQFKNSKSTLNELLPWGWFGIVKITRSPDLKSCDFSNEWHAKDAILLLANVTDVVFYQCIKHTAIIFAWMDRETLKVSFCIARYWVVTPFAVKFHSLQNGS